MRAVNLSKKWQIDNVRSSKRWKANLFSYPGLSTALAQRSRRDGTIDPLETEPQSDFRMSGDNPGLEERSILSKNTSCSANGPGRNWRSFWETFRVLKKQKKTFVAK